MRGYAGRWQGFTTHYSAAEKPTGVPFDRLQEITEKTTRLPEGFDVHSKIARQMEARREHFQQRQPIDWSLAEHLAFGSLLQDGIGIRLSGQDSGRGTFSQRHAALFDIHSGKRYLPLNALASKQAEFSVYDSMLSEAAVLGFEFGYSLDQPNKLVLWEAQFGDFANGGQVVIDQFIVCSESKWQRSSGLVMLLPHGYEGQGPEHSSARLERFLQMCAEDNIQVANLTTPAQYFHILRRQMKRDFRKPLVIMTPKSLLRHKQAVSPIEEFTDNTFHEVLDDPCAEPSKTRRVLLCSGKVYYDLLERRGSDSQGALIRVEQLYPYPEEQLRTVLVRYRQAKEWVWVQEESMNMGAWTFMEPRLRAMGYSPRYVGRDSSASPATGSRAVHLREQKELVEAAWGGEAPHLVRGSRNGQQVPKPQESMAAAVDGAAELPD